MSQQEVFEAWKRRKQRIEVPRGFADKVMIHIREDQPARAAADRATAFLQRMVAHRWAKAALIACAVPLGLARILLTLQLILFA